jgi:hypothetical protein
MAIQDTVELVKKGLPKNKFFEAVRKSPSVIIDGRLHQKGQGDMQLRFDGAHLSLSSTGMAIQNFDKMFFSSNSVQIDGLIKRIANGQGVSAGDRTAINEFIINKVFSYFESAQVNKPENDNSITLLPKLVDSKAFVAGFVYTPAKNGGRDVTVKTGEQTNAYELNKTIDALEAEYVKLLAKELEKKAGELVKKVGSHAAAESCDKEGYGFKWIDSRCYAYIEMPEHILISNKGEYYRFGKSLVGLHVTSGLYFNLDDVRIISPSNFRHPYFMDGRLSICTVPVPSNLPNEAYIAAYLRRLKAILLGEEKLFSWLSGERFAGARISKTEAKSCGLPVTNMHAYDKWVRQND